MAASNSAPHSTLSVTGHAVTGARPCHTAHSQRQSGATSPRPLHRALAGPDLGVFRQAFLKFDDNHDGTVTHAEFRQGLEKGLGCVVSTPDYEALVQHVDQDNSGRIDYFEFADKMKLRDIEKFKSDSNQAKLREHGNTGGMGSFALEQAKGVWRTKTPEPLAPGQELTEEQRVDRALDVKIKRAIENKSSEILTEFRKFDTDRDSMLTYAELRRGLGNLEASHLPCVRPPPSESTYPFCTHVLHTHEHKHPLSHIGPQVKFDEKEFDRLCVRLDADDTGFVDYGEFARYMQSAELQNRGHHATTGLGAIAGGQLAAERQQGEAVDAAMERGGMPRVLSKQEQEDQKLDNMIYEKVAAFHSSRVLSVLTSHACIAGEG